jgi:S1-C subfamily serine protease
MAFRMRCAAVGLVIVVMATGCRPSEVMNGAAALDDLSDVAVVVPPDPKLADHPVVAMVRSSVVRVRGLAYGCQELLVGTGFVVAPHRVMTNAHVVAGADVVSVELGDETYDARVVAYDPYGDISILAAPDLPAAPLTFADSLAFSGTDALMLGYPSGGAFVATPARVREITELRSMDIYRTTPVVRQVYTIRGTVRHTSGSPMIDLSGHVLGVVFGAASTDSEMGFVLTSDQIAPELATVRNTLPVPTGPCVSP